MSNYQLTWQAPSWIELPEDNVTWTRASCVILHCLVVNPQLETCDLLVTNASVRKPGFLLYFCAFNHRFKSRQRCLCSRSGSFFCIYLGLHATLYLCRGVKWGSTLLKPHQTAGSTAHHLILFFPKCHHQFMPSLAQNTMSVRGCLQPSGCLD